VGEGEAGPEHGSKDGCLARYHRRDYPPVCYTRPAAAENLTPPGESNGAILLSRVAT